MTKRMLVTFVASCALVACGGGSASSGGTRQGSHPDQGTAAPHIECGSGSGHHGGGCGDGSGGASAAPTTTSGGEGAAPATTSTTTTGTATTSTAPQ